MSITYTIITWLNYYTYTDSCIIIYLVQNNKFFFSIIFFKNKDNKL